MKQLTGKCISVFSALSAGVLAQTAVAGTLTEGKLIIGMEITYPPFESYDGDEVVGFDPELTALLAAKMGVEESFSDNKFTGLILGLGANKFDAVISGMYIKDERLKQADAVPYARTGASIMVPKNSKIMPKTDKELCGVKVGLQQGTSWVKAFKNLSDSYCVPNGLKPVVVQEFPSAPEATQAMLSGNVEAQVEIAGAAKMFIQRTKGRIQVSSTDLIYPNTLGIYVKKGNAELKSAFEKAMAEIKADGSYMKLIEKYELSPVN
ncbi:ABC transporter substrate-binding protein [Marinomonas mediterranea]|jgi:amino acid ABC transporter substrate-binding protein, PAAT family (TC 3.A.1.3.-)|uniref:ABC-type transporter, periplasmic subunit family 3 n=1 Tax=Marinomonas mediterranea (strain ATCC 700492 / JCM 21426 / NBRC 103028 / MMB-1) TaxID=717774 RepID=F2JY93_MARM1|nr:ABC transporter substrate-binding protein [Marinomonas mediterranea]ADZ91924.1 ABC-type transporter, periplasmic subunit family 3 [Marinomonas mediterranea MMB-1]WCN09874.1 transporter substrate-binding domain-containing protein [Marinomonas mediterranea]WCN13958.1 transporter substrate-binding domain-containing protein [Marinomonas mediterranea]WCN18010.1 transporter substrate-binding domain-containing protein [Marinomonas mediterranea MMB-1]